MKGMKPEIENHLRQVFRDILDEVLEAEGPEGPVEILGKDEAINTMIYRIKEA